MFHQSTFQVQLGLCQFRSTRLRVAVFAMLLTGVFVEAVGNEPVALGLGVVALLLRPKFMPSEPARIRVAIRPRLIKHFRLRHFSSTLQAKSKRLPPWY